MAGNSEDYDIVLKFALCCIRNLKEDFMMKAEQLDLVAMSLHVVVAVAKVEVAVVEVAKVADVNIVVMVELLVMEATLLLSLSGAFEVVYLQILQATIS